ncbi:MAG: hypothetical protein IJW65_00190 [Clostridia bacterium]|nr:hypothetical protein [Clostridia bacterium]
MQRNEDVAGAVRHMKKSGALWIVIFAFAAGIIMLIIGSNIKDRDGDEGESDGYSYSAEEFEIYKAELTSSITGSCEKMLSVDGVCVLLSFETSGEVIYAKNTNTSSDGDRREEYVIVGSGSNAQALYLGQKFPILSGIGVICPSGVTQGQRDGVAAFLSAAYGLPLTRIYVI